MLNRREWIGFAAAGLLGTLVALPAAAQAGDWPSKPIRIIVPFAPGGPNDTHLRYLGDHLSRILGVAVVIENMPGAAASIGMTQLAHAAPDGYTLGGGYIGTHAINPHVQKDIGFDPRKDFATVAQITEYDAVLMVNPKSSYQTFDDLVKAAKDAPGTLTYGSVGQGSLSQLITEGLAKGLGLEFIHVPYKGYAPARTDLMAGNIDFFFDLWGAATEDYLKTGMLRALGTTASQEEADRAGIMRIPYDLPRGWTGVYAPAGTPPEIVARLEAAFKEILELPETAAKTHSFGYTSSFAPGAELEKRALADYETFGKLIEALGIKPE